MKTVYKKTQYGIGLTIVLLLVIVFLTYSHVYQTGSKPLPLIPYIIITILFVLFILIFYKLTITIDQEKVTAIFGIGLLKKSIQIDEINTIENYKIPWYAGIGIRLTPKGWLWNVKTGNALLLKGKTKTFLVGSNEVPKLMELINNLKK